MSGFYAGLSNKEIARQFELPERKSKIATLLKQDRQAYCVCRSSDASRFMIGCDSCEEWFHGDCIGMREKESKYIKHYYCPGCRQADPSLVTIFKPKSSFKESSFKTEELKSSNKRSSDSSSESRKGSRPLWPHQGKTGCGQCPGCLLGSDCRRCVGCKAMRKSGGRSVTGCLMRQCIKLGRRQLLGDVGKPVVLLHRLVKVGGGRGVDKRGDVPIKERTINTLLPSVRSHKRRESAATDGAEVDRSPRQCYGPQCTQHARPGSKYCGDACGRALASSRIYQVLPQRIQEWGMSNCVAEDNNKKQLEKVRKQQLEVRATLQELEKKHKELEATIAEAKQFTVVERSEEDRDEEEVEMSMYCITCGHEIHSRTAIRHMEKCFSKYESQASFGSIYKTRIEGNTMFCDYYNPANRTYCKRLRVLCPEHSKEPKVSETEVCGCPLVTNVFELTGEYCRFSKKSCVRHYCWEKLCHAEYDMERVRQWLKLDELIEQERQIRQRLSDRAGVLALLLHSTYDHVEMDKMAAQAQDPSQMQALAQQLGRCYGTDVGGERGADKSANAAPQRAMPPENSTTPNSRDKSTTPKARDTSNPNSQSPSHSPPPLPSQVWPTPTTVTPKSANQRAVLQMQSQTIPLNATRIQFRDAFKSPSQKVTHPPLHSSSKSSFPPTSQNRLPKTP